MHTITRRILGALLLLGICLPGLQAQFMRSYYPFANANISGQQTSDGGYIIGGPNFSTGQGQQAYLIKTDYRGDTLWTRTYFPFGPSESVSGVIQTADGGYLVVGERLLFPVPGLIYFKTDAAGNVEWDRYLGTSFRQASGVVEGHDGFAVAGMTYNNLSYWDYYLVRTDLMGDTLWSQTYDLGGLGGIDRCYEVIATSDGGFLLSGITQLNQNALSQGVLLKVDSLGQVQWQANHSVPDQEVQLNQVIELANGNYLEVGTLAHSLTSVRTGYLRWTTASGQFLQEHFFSPTLLREINRVAALPNGDLLLAAYVFGVTAGDILLLRTTASGQVIWSRRFTTPASNVNDIAQAIGTTLAGGYYIVGSSSISNTALLIVTDSLGNTATNTIYGNFFDDLNLNCVPDSGEPVYATLPFTLSARNLATNSLTYASTDSNGHYQFTLSLGDYELTPVGHPYLDYLCQPLPVVSLTQPSQSVQVDVPLTETVICPLNRVDIASSLFRIGDSCSIGVHACNDGTGISYPTTVEVTLDNEVTFGGANYPLLSQVGQVFTFDLDTLLPGTCKRLQIRAWLDSTVVPAQTHCMEAKIWPDTLCGSFPAWSGPQIKAAVSCLGDSVRFDLTNHGAQMQAAHGYTIYIDDVIFRMGFFQLDNGMTEQLFEPATPGATYRIEAEQDPAFPAVLGDPKAIAFAEGCLPYASGGFQTGWVTAFYNGNSAPSEAIHCVINVSSYDPNDKLAQPVGYDAPHFIDENTPLDYQIRFQNTGTAPAFRVVILDTLPAQLDPMTIEPGASSHAYTWRVDDQGVLRFTFLPIFLPDSSSDEAGSQGYVRFRIQQRPGNLPGTRIENRAAIYFDYNVAVITPPVWHTIGEDFIRIDLISTPIADLAGSRARIWPNPASEQVHVDGGGPTYRLLTCQLYNQLGQPVHRQVARAASTLTMDLRALPDGLYAYRLEGDGRVLRSGLLHRIR